jgi:uncharacterized protein YdhG (YjbR/CyaY superfamily)
MSESTATNDDEQTASGFSEREREAMRQRAEELRAEGRSGRKKADDLQAVLDAIAAMADADRVLAERVHGVVTRIAPELAPKTWYGFPAYASGKEVVCFFKSMEKGEARYAELGFNDIAQLDDGDMWPTAYALVDWTPAVEAKVEDLIRRAV